MGAVYKTYETERLFLKPTDLDDAGFIQKLMNTPKWLKYIGDRNIHSVEDAENYIQNRMLTQLERLGYSNYTLITKARGYKIGTCGLYEREGKEGIDIGFAFLPPFEKLGYAFEAASKLRDIAFNELGIKEIQAYTLKDNISSQQLLEKLGLECIGTTNLPNDPEELLHYRIILR